jgi:hypothetical protein
VIVMLFATVLMVFLAIGAWLAARQRFGSSTAHSERMTSDAASAEAMREPTTLEGVLTAQLLRGEINRLKYQYGLERLAARDDEDHPLWVPDKG